MLQRRISPWSFPLWAVLWALGCQSSRGSLDREISARLLRPKIKEPITTRLYIGKVAVSQDTTSDLVATVKLRPQQSELHWPLYNELQAGGVIEITHLGGYPPGYQGYVTYYQIEIAGHKVEHKVDPDFSTPRICNRELREITGVHLSAEKTEATVEYIWHYTNLSRVAHASPTLRTAFENWGGDGSASLALYDDGWRVKDIHNSHETRKLDPLPPVPGSSVLATYVLPKDGSVLQLKSDGTFLEHDGTTKRDEEGQFELAGGALKVRYDMGLVGSGQIKGDTILASDQQIWTKR